MTNRFPHIGEVLGAAPARLDLAPVLSPELSLGMSRQRELLDLQAIRRIPGLVGYLKSDPQYLFEDSAGTIPASTSGTGPVGIWSAVGSVGTLGSELCLNGTFDSDLSSWVAVGGAAGAFSSADGGCYESAATTNTGGRYQDITASGVVEIKYSARKVSGSLGGIFFNVYEKGAYTSTYYSKSITTAEYFTETIRVSCVNGVRIYLQIIGGAGYDYLARFDNISVKQVLGVHAVQPTTANKPILRKTLTTGVYWADSNISTSALNVALGNLGSACTVARSGAEGVTFTDNAEITPSYNIAPTFGFNSDVALFNCALTATEKALITRYMQRAVPMLGSNLVTNGTFDTDTTGWTASASAQLSLSSGYMRVANNGAANQYAQQLIPALSTSKYYFATCLCKGDDGTGKGRFMIGSSVKQRDGAVSSSPQVLQVVGAPNAGAIYLFCLSATTTGVYAEFDNVTAQEIL